MILLVKQELFKLTKKKSTFISPLLLVVLIIATGVLTKKYSGAIAPDTMFTSSFSGTSWIVFIMIATSSTIISMESQYGTLKNLLYRKYFRGEILASKWLTLAIYSVFLYIVATVTSIIVKIVLFPSINFTQTLENGQTLLKALMLNILGSYIGLWLILSLVLMLACFINSSGAAISVGIVFYFASSIISDILTAVITKWEWIKWNPVSMLNLQKQLGNEKIMEPLTHLSTNQLLIGNVLYIIIFLGLGYVAFNKKNV
ncbi:ABC transporter permease [Enterococcus faecalis]|uniref:ABC transporter permease n=1 Tax=Enterococcus faecalis TaxID=1351 RepID=UPI00404351F6